ncbi:hypothetical protein GPALN_001874 [Globodera pallida]|nr:hypothetical protein GPALN_001874 [Globodera pallida]
MPSLPILLFRLLLPVFVLFLPLCLAQRRSVPIPLEMDRMLGAGREVYDKQSTPTQNERIPTSVKLAMYIEGIGSFRTHTMDFQLDVYLQQFWKDPRLAHNESSRILIRDKSILDRIWHPDVYFANARIAQFHEVTQPNFLVWIEPDGSILYDTRVSMIVICAMNLKNFPLDSQWCHLRILSYAYDINHLLIEWVDKAPITKNTNITMSDMDIVKLVPGTCDGVYSTGVWSCVTAEFFVSRELTHHILQTYVPTTLIVVISWFSFWLDVEAVPARVSLAITTLLTLSTQANSVKNSLPEVSYMKSLDLFLAVSVLFVFGVLIEFTIVNYTQRNATMAAAGLLTEEKGGGRDCALWRCLRKTLEGKWKKRKWNLREDSQQKHHKNMAAAPRHKRTSRAGLCGAFAGETMSHRQIPRKSGNKYFLLPYLFHLQKISALQTQHQLRHVLSSDGTKEAVVPIIVCDKGDNNAEQYKLQKTMCHPPRMVVDRREAARIACWASPELSCERLSLRARGLQTPPEGETAAGAGNVDEVGSILPEMDSVSYRLFQQPAAPTEFCSSSSPTSSTLSSCAVLLVPDLPQPPPSSAVAPCDETVLPLNSLLSRPDKPFIRRASAMASLLDPINIGSGGSTTDQQQLKTDNLEGEGKTAPTARRKQPSMSSQAKWRHAVRKLQMNKREAGRIQAKKIDAWSRWAFPLSYLSFQGAYWYYYLRLAA